MLKKFLITTAFAGFVFFVYMSLLLLPSIIFSVKNIQGSLASIEFYVKPENIEQTKVLITGIKNNPVYKKYIETSFEKRGKHEIIRFVFNREKLSIEAIEKIEKQLKDNRYLLFSKEVFMYDIPNFMSGIKMQIYVSLLTLLIFGFFWWLKFKKFEDRLVQSFSVRDSLKIIALTTGFLVLVQITFLLFKILGFEIRTDIFGAGKAFEDNIIQTFILLLVIAPVLEEIVFRGILYRIFLKNDFPKMGAIITSFNFAGLHLIFSGKQEISFYIFYSILYFCMSMLFIWIYKKYNSIWSAITAHSL